MSRCLATFALIGALLGITGCGGVAQDGAAGSFEPAIEGKLTVATAEVPTAGFWEGVAAEPTGGFEFELATEFVSRFGLDELQVVEVPFAELTGGDLGDADLALSQITPTDERDQVLDFSDPYLVAPPALLTDADLEVPDLETARDLTYSVETGTTLEEDLDQMIDPNTTVLVGADQDEVLAAVAEGNVDAAILDLPAASAVAEESDGALHVAAKLDTTETIAAALPEGSESNTEAVGSAIRALDADGTLGALSEEWFGSEITDGAPEVPLLRSSR